MPKPKDSRQFTLPDGKPRCMFNLVDNKQCQLEAGHEKAHYHRAGDNWMQVINYAKENNVQIEVSYLVNHKDDDGNIRTRNMTRRIDAAVIFGDDYPEVAQVNGFFIRQPWQPETPIEFVPRPYWMG
jgi:hypothetical protein